MQYQLFFFITYNLPYIIGTGHIFIRKISFEILYILSIPAIPLSIILGYLIDKISLGSLFDDTNIIFYIASMTALSYAILGTLIGMIIGLMHRKNK